MTSYDVHQVFSNGVIIDSYVTNCTYVLACVRCQVARVMACLYPLARNIVRQAPIQRKYGCRRAQPPCRLDCALRLPILAWAVHVCARRLTSHYRHSLTESWFDLHHSTEIWFGLHDPTETMVRFTLLLSINMVRFTRVYGKVVRFTPCNR